MTIDQTHFPEGVTLTVNPSVIHSSEELWGPDAREFVPERWFAPDAAERERRYFIPVRTCLPLTEAMKNRTAKRKDRRKNRKEGVAN